MEDGTASNGGSSDRRKTVSGPFPPFEDPTGDAFVNASDDDMRLPYMYPTPSPLSPPPLPTGSFPPGKSREHKRSFSGNILGRLNFLRSASDEERPPSRGKDQQPPQSPKGAKGYKTRKSIDDDYTDNSTSPVSPVKGESAMAAALAPAKARKRKGSLRKTALLGGRRLVTEGRERKNSLLPWNPSSKQQTSASQPPSVPAPTDAHASPAGTSNQASESDISLRHELSYESIDADSSTDNSWVDSTAATSARLSLLTDHTPGRAVGNDSTELSSPLNFTSPVSQSSYMSTTDDDDVLTFDSRTSSFGGLNPSIKKPLASGTSYFPPLTSVSQESLPRRVSTKKSRSSPLSHSITSPSPYQEPEPHDYTETEYWGWVILFVTWLTFTVGMGSCLEIWSWAWDVGETPYAPPELEDDETLPIVGYYPALIVLTGVVAWIWITIAWLGMKYFRHAKIEV